MARLKIPSEALKGVEYFLKLETHLRNEIINELDKQPVGLSSDQIIQKLSKRVDIKKSSLGAIITLFFSLFYGWESSGVARDDFIDDIIVTLDEINDKKTKPDRTLKSHLTKVLHSRGSFYNTHKARTLTSEREKLLLNTRILTDIRPIFNEEDDCKINSFLVIHNLKIEYSDEGRENKEIFFALDNIDLKKLKELILRAEEKEKTIKDQFSQINLPILDIK